MLAVAAAVIATVVAVVAGSPVNAASGIEVRPAAVTATWASGSARAFTLAVPAAAQPGDVLVATLAVGDPAARHDVKLSVPAGWTLAGGDHVGHALLAQVYWHVLAAGESSFTWQADRSAGGVGFVQAFAGVDPAGPLDQARTKVIKAGKPVDAPSVNAGQPGDALVASYAAYRKDGRALAWTPPTGMDEQGDAAEPDGNRSAGLATTVLDTAGSTGNQRAVPSINHDGAVATLLTLRPSPAPTTTTTAPTTTESSTTTTESTTTTTTTTPPPPPPPSGPVPLIIDTDLYTDVDDVGAVATAFGLQQQGEARVAAIGIDTRLDRPSVAVDSWRCAAAVAQYYGSADVPIGSAMPDDGTQKNSIDFAGPCADAAAASTPAPAPAVDVYRRALVAEQDGSVVMVGIGHLGNLAALLASPADGISPLTGRQLVARKVRMLVQMGGGYPSSPGETNLVGDPASAQAVASGWPTPVVWSGVEVGDHVHTGQTISATHPATSPVRIAYEHFVKPGNWIYSYDLTAVYHAVRPDDAALTPVGPGTNVVDSSGGNVFHAGSGDQHYLRLTDESSVEASIESLLDVVPAVEPPPPPPPATGPGPNDSFDAPLDPAVWSTSSTGSDVRVASGRLRIVHPAGGWTVGAVESVVPHDQTGRTLQLHMLRAANAGAGGATFGETSIQLRVDDTHYLEFWVANGTLTAWLHDGATSTNLTPTWPAYSAPPMQWLRFRESGGVLTFDYAAGGTSPGAWSELASVTPPFPLTSVTLKIIAGSNLDSRDPATFDDVSTFAG